MTINVKNVVQNRIAAQQQIGEIINELNAGTLAKYQAMDFSDIEETYDSIEKYVVGTANGIYRSFVVSGPAGVGKTSAVTRMLDQHAPGRYKVVAGHMTLIQLYGELYQHRSHGEIVVLDDIDNVFSKVEGVNLLKAATDSIQQRRISYATSSHLLQAWGIPKTFDYNGGIIVISNETQRRRNGGKLGQHISAVTDRMYVLSLGSNDKNEQYHQLCYQVIHHGLLSNRGLNPDQERKVLDYIGLNLDRLQRISLRTATKLADLVISEPNNWREMAKIGVLDCVDAMGGE